jgi:hypothetical protein
MYLPVPPLLNLGQLAQNLHSPALAARCITQGIGLGADYNTTQYGLHERSVLIGIALGDEAIVVGG